ncbi:MerR family DNA-binding transcriptional regulator [Burkholderia cepacia]|nr:MerR family DNA-binding transcriptional regulator [Burkholderia cepacia]
MRLSMPTGNTLQLLHESATMRRKSIRRSVSKNCRVCAMDKKTQLLMVGQAAALLGVSRGTIREWDRTGKLTSYRDPDNGYRLFCQSELVALAEQLSEGREAEDHLSLSTRSVRSARRLVNRISRLMRDLDGSSDLLGRFDELSKMWILEAACEQGLIEGNALNRLPLETDSQYGHRLHGVYKRFAKSQSIFIPERFSKMVANPIATAAVMDDVRTSLLGPYQDGLGLAYEEMVRRTFDKSENQQFFTPSQLTAFMISLAAHDPMGFVGDPACGSGGFLVEIAKSNADFEKLWGFEIDERLAWIAGVNLMSHGLTSDDFTIKYDVRHGSLGNGIDEWRGKLDTIITNPPFGSDVGEATILNQYVLGKGKISRRRGVLFLERCADLLRPGGRLFTVIDDGVLSQPNAADVRILLREKYDILGVISLPDSSFMPYATVKTSIVILQRKAIEGKKNHKEMFCATADSIGRRPNGDEDIIYGRDGSATINSDLPTIAGAWSDFLKGKPIPTCKGVFTVKIDTVVPEKGQRIDVLALEPHRRQLVKRLGEIGDSCVPLSDLCVERNELVHPMEELEGELISYTGLADIESMTGRHSKNIVPAISLKSQVKRYKRGDILFARMRPNLRKVAFVEEDDGFVSPECIVLKTRESEDGKPIVDRRLLATLLRSDVVYAQVEGKVTGIGRPRISADDLLSCLVPLARGEALHAAMRLHLADVQTEADIRLDLERINERLAQQVKRGAARLADVMLGEDNLDALAHVRHAAEGRLPLTETRKWLNETIGPKLKSRLRENSAMRRISVFEGTQLPLAPEVISSVRGRVSQFLETQFGDLMEATLHDEGLVEAFIGTVAAHQYPDFELRFSDDTKGLRFEVKAIESLADEAAANFATLLGQIREETDYLALIVWAWDESPSRIQRRRTPQVQDIRFFHARSLALMRDHHWLTTPDRKKGKNGLQGFDSLRAWTGVRDNLEHEQNNYGKILRLFDSDIVPTRLAAKSLVAETIGDFWSFKVWLSRNRFEVLRDVFLPAVSELITGGLAMPTAVRSVSEDLAVCGPVGLAYARELSPKARMQGMKENSLTHLFYVTAVGRLSHLEYEDESIPRKVVGRQHQSKDGSIRPVDWLAYCEALSSTL